MSLPRARRAASEPPIGSPSTIHTQADAPAVAPALAAAPIAGAPSVLFPSVPVPSAVPTVPQNPYGIPPYGPQTFLHPQYHYLANPYLHYGFYPPLPLPTALDSRRRYSPEPEETPTNYPLISDWLDELNSGSRSDGHNFAQFGGFLHQNGYTRLYQLADEFHRENGPKELMELCPGMTLGLAKLLLKYAAKDCQKIKDHH